MILWLSLVLEPISNKAIAFDKLLTDLAGGWEVTRVRAYLENLKWMKIRF